MAAWLLLAGLLAGADDDKFTDVLIEQPFAVYLRANPLLMEVPGAKIIRLDDGKQMILAVASTVLADDRAKTRQDAEKVCRLKALASVVAEKQGAQVAHVEKVEERTVIVLEDGKEKGKSVSEVLQITQSHVKGLAPGLSVVGRWKSKDGQTFYLALGLVCDKKGNPVRAEPPR